MTPEPKLMTISSSRNIRRRWLPNRPPRVGWALVLATVLAISTAFIYAARGVMYASAVRWANGLEMDSGIEFLAEKGLLALVALTAGVALWTFFCSRRQFWTLVSAGVGVVTAYALSECRASPLHSVNCIHRDCVPRCRGLVMALESCGTCRGFRYGLHHYPNTHGVGRGPSCGRRRRIARTGWRSLRSRRPLGAGSGSGHRRYCRDCFRSTAQPKSRRGDH